MGGGIRTNVKGYIKKRVTLAVDDNIIEDEKPQAAAAAAGCVDTKPQQQEPSSSFSETSSRTSLGASNSAVSYEKWQLLKIKHPECSSASASKLDGVPMDPAVLDDITTRLLEVYPISEARPAAGPANRIRDQAALVPHKSFLNSPICSSLMSL